MRAFFALLKLSLKSLLLTTVNMGAQRKKRKAASGVGALVLICVLLVFISGSNSFSMGAALSILGGLDIMLMQMILMSIGFPLVLTLFAGQGLVFNTKDLDLVLSLPVSSFTIMLARILALYLQTALMVELLLIPAGSAYLVFGGGGGAAFMVLLIVLGAFLALLPTLASLVFGTIISLLVSRMRHKNLFTVIFSILLMAGVFVGSFALSGISAIAAESIEGLRAGLLAAVPPLGWVLQALTGPNLFMALCIALACTLPFLAVTWVFSRFYKRVLTALSGHASKRNFTLRFVRSNSAFRALLKKEAGRFVGTPAYILNHGFGIVFILGLSVFAAIRRDAVLGFLHSTAAQGYPIPQNLIALLLLATVAFFLSTICTSSVSISLEGKTLWILKEAPLSPWHIFAAKAGFNFLLSGGSALIALPLLGYAFSLPVLHVVCMTLVAVLLAAFMALSGLYINLQHPRMDVGNDTLVIKQSSSVLFTMLLGVFAMLLGGGIFVICSLVLGWPFAAFCAVASVVYAAMCALAFLLLNTKGLQAFANL